MQKVLAWFLAISTNLVTLGLAVFFWLTYNLTTPSPSWLPNDGYLLHWKLILVWAILLFLSSLFHFIVSGFFLLHGEVKKSLRISLMAIIFGGLIYLTSHIF